MMKISSCKLAHHVKIVRFFFFENNAQANVSYCNNGLNFETGNTTKNMMTFLEICDTFFELVNYNFRTLSIILI